jgi:hypothetical protein
MKNLHTDLDKYTDQWEKALKDGIFADAPKLPPATPPDFFGQWDGGDEDVQINECDAKYWAQVYARSSHSGEAPDILKEEPEATKSQVMQMSKAVGNSANPVYPPSDGKDQNPRVTPNWTDGKELRELADLKKQLEKLESEMNAEEGVGKSGDSIQKKINNMREKLENLSNSLTGRDRYDNIKNMQP